MNIWIYRDNRQQGPYTFEQLEQMGLTPKTPVWYEGLTKWLPAGEAPLTRSLFESGAESTDGYVEVTEVKPTSESAQPQQAGWFTAAESAQTQTPAPTQAKSADAPPSNLFWAIFSTLCCCMPLGIVSIIMSAQSRSRAKAGDMESADKYSEASAWLIMISFACGMITVPFSLLVSM